MLISNKASKVTCLLVGIILVIISMYSFSKNFFKEKFEVEIIKVVDSFTEKKTIRSGNDGGRGTYLLYGEIVEIINPINGQIERLSITRRNKDNLPAIDETIFVSQDNHRNWYEYEKASLSVGNIIMGFLGVILLAGGAFGKVRS